MFRKEVLNGHLIRVGLEGERKGGGGMSLFHMADSAFLTVW